MKFVEGLEKVGVKVEKEFSTSQSLTVSYHRDDGQAATMNHKNLVSVFLHMSHCAFVLFFVG